MRSRKDLLGVSPILAVLLMVAVTLVIGGAVAIWLWGFTGETEERTELYLFDAELFADDDSIHITMIKGNPVNTTHMRLVLDGTFVPAPVSNLSAGNTLEVPLEEDIGPGSTHTLKIVINYSTVYESELTASV